MNTNIISFILFISILHKQLSCDARDVGKLKNNKSLHFLKLELSFVQNLVGKKIS